MSRDEQPINDEMVAKMLEGAGYRNLVVEPLARDGVVSGEFVATATKTVGVTPYKASAKGNTPALAARELVKVVTRL